MSTSAEVRSELAELDRAEEARSVRMKASLQQIVHVLQNTQASVKEDMAPSLDRAIQRVGALEKRFQTTASMAEKLYHEMNVLYEERRRVEEAMHWCAEVTQLRTSLGLLADALERLDWDACIRYCRDALSVSGDVLHSEFARAVVVRILLSNQEPILTECQPTSMHPEMPPQFLSQLRTSLLQKISQNFEHYTRERNEEQATRFLGYFAAIDAHEEGLAAYRYVCACVQDFLATFCEICANVTVILLALLYTPMVQTWKNVFVCQVRLFQPRLPIASSNSVYYGMLWTALFEYLAIFINKHQPVVDRLLHAPGHSNFLQGVLPSLEREWTRLGLSILEAWHAERQVDKIVAQVNGAKFVALEKVRAVPFTPGRIFGQEDRSNNPANSAMSTSSPAVSMSDSLHVDPLLSEMVSFSAQWTLFEQFLRRSMQPTPDVRMLHTGIQDALTNVMMQIYVPLQTYALRASVEQVHNLDTPDLQSRSYSSSLPDDMFFALRAVLTRALSTSSLAIAERVISHAISIVENDYVEIVVLRMDGCRRALNISRLVDGPRRSAAVREVRTTICVYLNVLDVSAMYTDRILADLSSTTFLEAYFDAESRSATEFDASLGSDPSTNLQSGKKDAPAPLTPHLSALALAQSAVGRLSVLTPKLRTTLHFEMEELFRLLVEPRIQALVSDVLRDMEYRLDEISYARVKESDAMADRVRTGWNSCILGFRDQLTESNYALLFTMAVDALVLPWEQAVMQLAFTELGALRFDKDLRGVFTALSDLASWGIRDKFLRLQQISYVLNMDEDETDSNDVFEAGIASGISWQLTPAEVQSVRSLRVNTAPQERSLS